MPRLKPRKRSSVWIIVSVSILIDLPARDWLTDWLLIYVRIKFFCLIISSAGFIYIFLRAPRDWTVLRSCFPLVREAVFLWQWGPIISQRWCFGGYDIRKGHCKLFTVTRVAWRRRDRPIISPRNLPLLKHLERDTKSLPDYTDTALCPTPLSRPPTSLWRGTRTHFTGVGDGKERKKKKKTISRGKEEVTFKSCSERCSCFSSH